MSEYPSEVASHCAEAPAIVLAEAEVARADFGGVEALLDGAGRDAMLSAPGREHYRLLAHMARILSEQTPGALLLDIGTHHGLSALALSSAPAARVISFDIADHLSPGERRAVASRGNLTLSSDDVWSEAGRRRWRRELLSAALIFVDVEPHGGAMELDLFLWLAESGFRGLLLCDDIWYFKPMRDVFWARIPDAIKDDLTPLGHWSGTGLIRFGRAAPAVLLLCEDEEVGASEGRAEQAPKGAAAAAAAGTSAQKQPLPIPPAPRGGIAGTAAADWTAVTALFDLSRQEDATPEIRARPPAHYLAHAAMTLAAPVPLVVYCEPDLLPALQRLRPAHLLPHTRFVARPFVSFALVRDMLPRVLAARAPRTWHVDPRNTASYYLLCMLRYVMLLETIAENPFGSTHFAWINVCIERMSFRSAALLPRVWAERRARFSTCYIDYQPRSLAADLPRYYAWGRCGMCSGFFTGDAAHMAEVSRRMLDKFAELAAMGLGHADEQLLTLVYFDRPDLFEPYLGDYAEMVVNYGRVREGADKPLRNVLRNLAASREDPLLLAKLAARWLDSERRGCFAASPEARLAALDYFHQGAAAAFPELGRTWVV